MEEGDPLAFGAESGMLVDEADSVRPAALEGRLEIVHGEAHVVDTRATLGNELTDRRVG